MLLCTPFLQLSVVWVDLPFQSIVTLSVVAYGNAGQCTDPPVIEHATRDGPIGQKVFPLGTQLTYSCAPGYSLDGFFRAMCVGEGRWVGPRMTCSRKNNADRSTSPNYANYNVTIDIFITYSTLNDAARNMLGGLKPLRNCSYPLPQTSLSPSPFYQLDSCEGKTTLWWLSRPKSDYRSSR